jgi:hypothetical protein
MTFPELLTYWPAFIALSLLAISATFFYYWIKRRPDAVELERRRRMMINSIGKMGDGAILEFHKAFISYTYHVRGISYQASQDISGLERYLPAEQMGTIDAISVKYDGRNPANSIVLCEKWSGLPNSSNTKEIHDQ